MKQLRTPGSCWPASAGLSLSPRIGELGVGALDQKEKVTGYHASKGLS